MTPDYFPKLSTRTWACTPQGLNDWLNTFSYRAPVAQDETKNAFGDTLPTVQVRDGVAIIEITGILISGATALEKLFGAMDYADVSERLTNADQDPSVRAIVLLINSPGGSVAGAEELSAQVAALSKPCTVFVSTMAASAAFWVSCAADQIVVAPGAVLGCIGTILTFLSFEDALKAEGVHANIIQSGSLKAAGSNLKKMSDDERAMLQNLADEQGARFRATVSASRPQIASGDMEGQIFGADSAIKKHFADRIIVGGLSEAIATAGAGIDDSASVPSPQNPIPFPENDKITEPGTKNDHGLPTKSQLEARWKSDAALRRDFVNNFEGYVATMNAHSRRVSGFRNSPLASATPARTVPARGVPRGSASAAQGSYEGLMAAGRYEDAYAVAPAELKRDFTSAKHFAAFAKANAEGRIRNSARRSTPASTSTPPRPLSSRPAAPQQGGYEALLAAGKFEEAFAIAPADVRKDFDTVAHFSAWAKANSEGRIRNRARR